MKRYSLTCECGCSFLGYFSGIASAKRQLRSGLVECIACGSTNVKKTGLHTPNTKKSPIYIKHADQAIHDDLYSAFEAQSEQSAVRYDA